MFSQHIRYTVKLAFLITGNKKLCKQKFYHLNSTFPVYLVKCSPQRTTLIDCFLQNFYNRNGRRICDHDCQLIFADKTPALLLLEEFKQSDQGVYRYVMSEQSNRAYQYVRSQVYGELRNQFRESTIRMHVHCVRSLSNPLEPSTCKVYCSMSGVYAIHSRSLHVCQEFKVNREFKKSNQEV